MTATLSDITIKTDKRLLVVDDVSDNLRLLHKILRKEGYRLSFASSGKQAIERITKKRPDLVLLDLMMPDIDGLEVCKRIRQDPKVADVPIIFITASHEVDHLVAAFEEGARDYITKPFRAPELYARIETCLELMQVRLKAQQQAAREAMLRKLIAGVHRSLELADILNFAAADLKKYLAADIVAISRILPMGRCSVVASTVERQVPHPCPASHFPFSGKPRYFDLDDNSGPEDRISLEDRKWIEAWGMRSELRFPLVPEKGVTWGILSVLYESPRHWQGDEGFTLQPSIEQLSIAIEQAEIHRRLQTLNWQLSSSIRQLESANTRLKHLSRVDGLTQIANRRLFDSEFSREWLRSRREEQPLSVILLDIDRFKQYNDRHGHVQGDKCLQAVASALQDALQRGTDILARYGGEEFVALLPHTDREGAVCVAKRLQEAVANLEIPHHATDLATRVTLSLGIATTVPTLADDAIELLSRADRALYAAKSRGRDCYAIASEL